MKKTICLIIFISIAFASYSEQKKEGTKSKKEVSNISNDRTVKTVNDSLRRLLKIERNSVRSLTKKNASLQKDLSQVEEKLKKGSLKTYHVIFFIFLLAIISFFVFIAFWGVKLYKKIKDKTNFEEKEKALLALDEKNKKLTESFTSFIYAVTKKIKNVKTSIKGLFNKTSMSSKEEIKLQSTQIIEQFNLLRKQIEKSLDEIKEGPYNKESIFLTHHLMNEWIKDLGQRVAFQTIGTDVELSEQLSTIIESRDNIKQQIESLNKTESKLENEILEKAINQLQTFEEFLYSMVDYAVKLSHSVFNTKCNLSKGVDPFTKEKYSEDQKKLVERNLKSKDVLYHRVVSRIEETGMVEVFTPEVGSMWDESDYRIEAIGGGIYHPEKAKYGIIAEVHNPAFIMGKRIIKPAEVMVYTDSERSGYKYDER